MNKTLIKYISITIALILVVLGIRGCLNAITHKMITDETISTTDETTETEYIQKQADEHTISAIVYSLLTEVDAFDKYPITQKFKEKFKNKYGIILEIDNSRMVDSGMITSKENELIPIIDLHWKDKYRNDGCLYTTFYFDYKVDENEQLDDLILLRKVDYGSDGKRIDGKKEIDMVNLSWIIYAFINPDDEHLDTEIKKTPLSNNCEIINKPEQKIAKDKDFYNDKKEHILYMKFKYYDDSIGFWKVSYNINDDYQFDRLEFISIDESDLSPNIKEYLSDEF